MQDPCITVRVGPTDSSRDRFIHTSLLEEHSPFFKAALEREWKEKKEKLITLPEDKIEVFDLYCAWLYGRDPFALTHPLPCKCPEAEAQRTAHSQLLRLTWQFGDKILDHDFCDMVIDKLIGHFTFTNRMPQDQVFYIYQSCAAGVPVRRLLPDGFVHLGREGWLTSESTKMTEEAYKDVINALLKNKALKPDAANVPWESDACVYHWHKKEGGVCYKNKAHWSGIRKS